MRELDPHLKQGPMLKMIDTFIYCNFTDLDTLNNAFIYAVGNHYLEALKLLISNPYIDVNGYTDLTFLLSMSRGNTELVEILLQRSDLDINKVNSRGETALFIAASEGCSEIVEMLLGKKEIDVNRESKEWYEKTTSNIIHIGRTALYMATIKNHTRVVQLLVQRSEIEINKGYTNGRTVLHEASLNGYSEIVKHLLRHANIDVNKKDEKLKTALYMASKGGKVEIVKLLTSHPEVDINEETPEINEETSVVTYLSSLWKASQVGEKAVVQILLDQPTINVQRGSGGAGHFEIKKLLFRGDNNNTSKTEELIINTIIGNTTTVESLLEDNDTDINYADIGGRTPLMWASNLRHLDIIKLILSQEGLDVNKERAKDGMNALLLAASNGHPDVLKLLLGNVNIDVNCADPDLGETSLYKASQKGHLKVVSLLLGHKEIKVNKATVSRETPLMAATQNGFSNIVRELLAHAAIDVNFYTFEGATALHHSLNSSERQAIVEILLRCPSTDVSLRDQNYKTSRDYAEEKNLTNILPIFEKRALLTLDNGHTCCSDTVNDGLQKAAEQGDLKMVKSFLLCSKVVLNLGYRYGQTPLYTASMHNHPEVVAEILNDPRTDVNFIVNSDNALFTASQKGHTEIVRLLLNHHNIDVNIRNSRNGKTALMIASEKQHIDILKLILLNPQTFVNKVDTKEQSALSVSLARGYLRVVKLLLRCPKTNLTTMNREAKNYKQTDIADAISNQNIFHQMNDTCCLHVKQGLQTAAWAGDFREISGLLQCPGSERNVNVADEKGRTLLFITSMMGHIQALKVLLHHSNIDVNIGVTLNGKTAFSIASEKAHFKIMRALIDHGRAQFKRGWCSDKWAHYASMCHLTLTSSEVLLAEKTVSTTAAAQGNTFFSNIFHTNKQAVEQILISYLQYVIHIQNFMHSFIW